MEIKDYILCESINTFSGSPWHIRKSTVNGKKLGGGADSSALCGSEVSWDLNIDIDDTPNDCAPDRYCQECFNIFMEIKDEER